MLVTKRADTMAELLRWSDDVATLHNANASYCAISYEVQMARGDKIHATSHISVSERVVALPPRVCVRDNNGSLRTTSCLESRQCSPTLSEESDCINNNTIFRTDISSACLFNLQNDDDACIRS